MKKTVLSLAVLVAAAAAQAPKAPRILPYPVSGAFAYAEAVRKGTRTATGEPGPAYWTNHARYAMEAELDPATARVTGRLTITYENRSPRPLRSLTLHLRQNMHRADAQRNVNVELTDGMDVTDLRVRVGTRKWRKPRVSVSGTTLRVSLRRMDRVPSGESVELEMGWGFRVPGRAPRMGHEDKHVYYLGYWYPQLAVNEDVRGWVADPYLGSGEFYMGYADYDLRFTAPAGWLVRATGALQNPEEVLTDTQLGRLEQAARTREIVNVLTAEELQDGKATRASGSGKLTWHFKAEDVRDCAVSVSDRYVWDATHAVVKGPGRDGKTMVHAVYEPRARFWKDAAEFVRHAIEFMSREVLPYPWPHMTACEGIVGGGMEYPMMTDIGTYPSRRSFYEVVSHETIHMWWPMIVGTNEKQWSWMDEGITTFMESRAAADYFEDPRPWRQAMGTYRSLGGPKNEAASMNHADHFPPGKPMAYFLATYEKPSAVLHQLRSILGAEEFDEALRTYTREWAYKHPYPRDLFSTFNRVTGRDLDWYWRTWFYETWTLDSAIKEVRRDGEKTIVVVEDRGRAFGPTRVQVTYDDGRKATKEVPAAWWRQGHRTAEVTFGQGVTRARLDPDRRTLDRDRANDAWSAER